MTGANLHRPRGTKEGQRPFSLTMYLPIVVVLSWPFQLAYVLWGFDGTKTPLISYSLSSLSMVMVAVGTFIAGRYVFRDGFAGAGWSWGEPKHYLAVFGLAALVWVVPTALERVLGIRSVSTDMSLIGILTAFLVLFVATLIPGFGEEFGWRGYMLRRLARRYSVRKALLVHAFIWWAWHVPAIVGIGMRTEVIEGAVGLNIAIVLIFSMIPSMMNAIIFAYVWSSTQSLAVASVYHSAFDETRDSLQATVGFGPFVDLWWQNSVLTLLGALLLWKGNWNLGGAVMSGQQRPGSRLKAEPGMRSEPRGKKERAI